MNKYYKKTCNIRLLSHSIRVSELNGKGIFRQVRVNRLVSALSHELVSNKSLIISFTGEIFQNKYVFHFRTWTKYENANWVDVPRRGGQSVDGGRRPRWRTKCVELDRLPEPVWTCKWSEDRWELVVLWPKCCAKMLCATQVSITSLFTFIVSETPTVTATSVWNYISKEEG